MVYYCFLLALVLILSVLAKRLARKSVSNMTYKYIYFMTYFYGPIPTDVSCVK